MCDVILKAKQNRRVGRLIEFQGEVYILAQISAGEWILIGLSTANRRSNTTLFASATAVNIGSDKVQRYISGIFKSNEWTYL
jgi:hypothetical protein